MSASISAWIVLGLLWGLALGDRSGGPHWETGIGIGHRVGDDIGYGVRQRLDQVSCRNSLVSSDGEGMTDGN